MAFISRLTTEWAVAGGVSGTAISDRAQFTRPVLKFDLRNLYFKEGLPTYDGALRIDGDCAGHGGVNDGDIVLYKRQTDVSTFSKGDIGVFRAIDAYPEIDFNEDWKCLRVFKGMGDDGLINVTSLSGDAEKMQSLKPESLIGRGVFAFSV